MATPRELAREQMNDRILQLGRKQLAEVGAAGLSVRALTRELGVSSSAVYRYVASRDELLTRLIVDSYEAVGAAVEEAVRTARGKPLARWRRACAAMREWAHTHPQQWALLYGSPVPGYQAPEETLAPAGRVAVALVSVVSDCDARPQAPRAAPARRLMANLARVAPDFGAADGPAMLALVSAFTRLVGTLSLELSGHLVGTAEPHSAYWDWLVDELAHELGLVD
ncbi:TetR/AcrR family transcriptional regulator [Naumannella sp. ID2617S]|nr:TetR/AcrR family transcriptional regulator [Naumannella sp. ID2617S]